MSYEITEYAEVDLTPDDAREPRPPSPWVWAVVGLLLGTFAGYTSVADFEPSVPVDQTLPPLTLPVQVDAAPDQVVGAMAPRRILQGFNQTLWILVDADNPRLLRWSPHQETPSEDVQLIATLDPRPDASGAAYAEEVEITTGSMLVVTRSAGDYVDDRTTTLSLDTNGWAWHTSFSRRIAWSEPAGDSTIIRWTSFGPNDGYLEVDGQWQVVEYEDRIVAQSDTAALFIDPEGIEPLVERSVPSGPLIIQGTFNGLVYGVHGPDKTMIAMELNLGNEARVEWRHPDALRFLDAPGNAWGALWFGRSVEVHGPEGEAFTHVASTQPHWSADGRFLIFGDGGTIVAFDTISAEFSTFPLGERVLAVWGS